ncbi:hypothetical protein APSETT444_010327 [Aspergillus pseudonomiae]
MIFNELDMLKDGQDTGDDLAVGKPTEVIEKVSETGVKHPQGSGCIAQKVPA